MIWNKGIYCPSLGCDKLNFLHNGWYCAVGFRTKVVVITH